MTGIKNEKELLNYYNNKYIYEFKENQRMFLDKIFKINPNEKIYCIKKGGRDKTDIIISHNNIEVNISLKIGKGNSTHQEKLDFFLEFLGQTFMINNSLKDDFRFYIWGDGTLDGNAKISDRIKSNSDFKKGYPDCVERIRAFFSQPLVKYTLIKRAIFKGRISNFNPEIIYHGNKDKFEWCYVEDFINELIKMDSKRALFPIGGVNFQPWNRSLEGKNEHYRGSIQIKLGNKTTLIKKINNHYE